MLEAIKAFGNVARLSIEPRAAAQQTARTQIDIAESLVHNSKRALKTKPVTTESLRQLGEHYKLWFTARTSRISRRREIVLLNRVKIPLPPRQENYY